MAKGVLHKMWVAHKYPVEYTLALGKDEVRVNDFVNTPLKVSFTGAMYCAGCKTAISKRYGQGYCYPCFSEGSVNSECIVRPELCQAHLGKGRDPEWEKKHHNQPHVVYLANSGGLKVGVTRNTQVPTRWIDQGASQALIIARTPYRQLAGKIEVSLKEIFSDQTNWQRMLRGYSSEVDFDAAKEQAWSHLAQNLRSYCTHDEQPTTISYPYSPPSNPLKAINLMKTPSIEGVLLGIRGQYLLFDSGQVINIRKHQGMEITWKNGVAQPVQGSLF